MESRAHTDVPRLSRPARFSGVILGLYGGINLMALLVSHFSGSVSSGRDDAIFAMVSSLMVGAGVGLFSEHRWAWPIAISLGIGGIGIGVFILSQPLDLTLLGAPIAALIFFLIPGALLTAVLLSPRTLRWLRPRR